MKLTRRLPRLLILLTLSFALLATGAGPAVAAPDPLVPYYFLPNLLVNGGLSTNGTTTEYHYGPTWYFNAVSTLATRIMTDADGWASMPTSMDSAVPAPYHQFSVMGGPNMWAIGGFDVKNSGANPIEITVTSTPSGGSAQVDTFTIPTGTHTVSLSGHSPQGAWASVAITFANTVDLSFNHFRLATYTESVAPTISSGTASAVTATSATVSGDVTWDGGDAITARGICYSTSSSSVTTADSKVTATADAGAFTASLTGLAAGTTYYARAYATNAVGTSYGELVTFTTTGAAPAASVPANSAWSLALMLAAGLWVLAAVRRHQLGEPHQH